MTYENPMNAAKYIEDRIIRERGELDRVKALIILGSALGTFADKIKDNIHISYKDIPGFSPSTVAGHAGELIYGYINDRPIFCMKGRTHIYEGNSPKQTIFPIRTLSHLGVKTIILTNAAGGINWDYSVGDFMIIEDYLSFFLDSPLIGPNDKEYGIRFPSMDEAYSKKLIDIAYDKGLENKVRVHKGVYAYMTGPQFESPAEIRALRVLGADAVGMSTVAETIAGVHAGMEVLGISCISNLAAGMSKKKLSHEDVNEVESLIATKFSAWMEDIICQL